MAIVARVWRTAALLTLGVGAGVVAHALGGGTHQVSLAAVLGVFVTLVVPVWVVLRRPLTTVRVGAVLGMAQVVTHLLLSLAALHAVGAGGHSGGHHGAAGAATMTDTHEMGLHISGAMLLAHTSATLLVSLLWGAGEESMRRIDEWMGAVLATVVRPSVVRLVPLVPTPRPVSPTPSIGPPIRGPPPVVVS